MMECNMAEQSKAIPASSVMKRTMIGSFLLIAATVLARIAGVLPMPQDQPPIIVIIFCTTMTLAMLWMVGWYMRRTDEHDLHANLWSMMWAWVANALITINWVILQAAGIIGAPDAMHILLASAAVAALVWAWLRFR
jgi:hypothetical protein